MRRNTLITLGVSTAFGALAIVLARGWIDAAVNVQTQQQGQVVSLSLPEKKIKTVPVMVADIPLHFGDRLTPQNVRLVEFPAGSVPEGSFSDFDTLFANPNFPTVVLGQMAANEPVLNFKLSGPGGRATLSAMLGENMRAVSIRVNAISGVAGFVQPGDTVDIFFLQQLEDTKGQPSARARYLAEDQIATNYQNMVLVQNIKILGSDQRSETVNNQVQVVKTVTVEVTPEQAQKLALAMRVGELSLSLRKAGAKEEIAPEIMKSKDISADFALVKPKPAPKTRRTVQRPRTSVPTPPPTTGVASVIVVRDGKMDQVSVFKDTDQPTRLAGG